MSEKSDLYNALKELGADFEKPYVNYTVDELKELARQLTNNSLVNEGDEIDETALDVLGEAFGGMDMGELPPPPQSAPVSAPTAPPQPEIIPTPRAAQRRTGRPGSAGNLAYSPGLAAGALRSLRALVVEALQAGELKEGRSFTWLGGIQIPVQDEGAERAGLTYSTPHDQPIRVDLQGRIWFRDEVAKPAVPRARMTRKQTYTETGVVQERTYLPNGQLDDVYEVSGGERKQMTVTTTTPSWQVGRFLDPRFPFQIHRYNRAVGFSSREIIAYYGGVHLVPRSIRTLYVGNQLCYDIATTKETIESQFNALKRSN